MATRVAIAIMREQALNGIADATGKIAAALGIEAPEIPTQGKDADLLYAQQLQAIADYLSGVAEQVSRFQAASDNQKQPEEEPPLTPENDPGFVQAIDADPWLDTMPPKPTARRKGR